MKSCKLILILSVIGIMMFPFSVFAARGCCSSHGGVVGCSSDGRQICADGTFSPTCRCTPPAVYGCTDRSAKNYNSNANRDDGSCQYFIKGCTDENAKNYNSSAEKDDGSCEYFIEGCMDKNAYNYDETAEKDDGSCKYYIYGCTDKSALNYNEQANKADGSCKYKEETSEEESSNPVSDFLGFITVSGIGAGIYFANKKKK